MQFYYNSGIPQRQRRTRDGRHSSVNRDVPAFLSFPDGSHSLGVISQHGDVETEARGDHHSGSLNGPFIVWADPVQRGSADRSGDYQQLQMFFHATVGLNILLNALFFFDLMRYTYNKDILSPDRVSPPSMAMPIASFILCVLFKLIGAWGVFKKKIRYISIFISFVLFFSLVNLLWIATSPQLAGVFIDILLVLFAHRVRARLMGEWFSATR
uniref:Uncharacterized protein n=1 Tax=Guillardia theta TaxID=55529 RepID=A0A7S4KLJ7_GUITH|mmetsp:Transcript_26796/g.87754  ORF Transcript_26796/g.87754 Transcript_26796/m.87754 type:complete len:213 (+) Transcript_26796:62-700(+)